MLDIHVDDFIGISLLFFCSYITFCMVESLINEILGVRDPMMIQHSRTNEEKSIDANDHP